MTIAGVSRRCTASWPMGGYPGSYKTSTSLCLSGWQRRAGTWRLGLGWLWDSVALETPHLEARRDHQPTSATVPPKSLAFARAVSIVQIHTVGGLRSVTHIKLPAAEGRKSSKKTSDACSNGAWVLQGPRADRPRWMLNRLGPRLECGVPSEGRAQLLLVPCGAGRCGAWGTVSM